MRGLAAISNVFKDLRHSNGKLPKLWMSYVDIVEVSSTGTDKDDQGGKLVNGSLVSQRNCLLVLRL